MRELHTRLAYPILLTGAALWCGLIVLAPITASAGAPGFSRFLYSCFGTVCHQFDSRSLHIAGYKFGVCARCSAVYFSFLAGLLVNPLVPRLRRLPFRPALAFALAPMLIDVALGLLDVHTPTLATRLFTGAVFGFIMSHVILALFDEALAGLRQPTYRPIQSPHVS